MATHSQVPPTFVPALEGALDGIDNAFPGGATASVVVLGETLNQAAAQTKVQGYLTIFQAPEKLAKAHSDACTLRDESYEDAAKWLAAFLNVVRGAVGESSTGLAQYAQKPRKEREPQTSEEQLVTVGKRNATRKARGTLGKKQKSKIHGTVPATTAPAPATSTSSTGSTSTTGGTTPSGA